MKKLLIALLFTFNASAMDMASYQMGITQGRILAEQEQKQAQKTKERPTTSYDCVTSFLALSQIKIVTYDGDVPAIDYLCSIGAAPTYSYDNDIIYVTVNISQDQQVVIGYKHSPDTLRLYSWNWIFLYKKDDRKAIEQYLRTLQ